MQVTSSYYRFRAQRSAYCAESLILQGADSSLDGALSNTPSKHEPLRPSRKTLRRLANLCKSDSANRVA